MSRLLTTLLLYRAGFVVCKYISLEKKIEKTKESYYQTLQQSSEGWLEEKNDNTPFVKYLLGTILAAYRDFEERLDLISQKLDALQMVQKACSVRLGKFTKNNIQEDCPSISKASIESALKKLCEQGKLERKGNGKATFYVRKSI